MSAASRQAPRFLLNTGKPIATRARCARGLTPVRPQPHLKAGIDVAQAVCAGVALQHGLEALMRSCQLFGNRRLCVKMHVGRHSVAANTRCHSAVSHSSRKNTFLLDIAT